MTPLSVVRVGGLCLSLLIGPVQTVSAELTPEQIGILANRNSSDSLAVARHYATRRGVPSDHIFQLDLPVNETISRDRYERRVILPLRQLLETRRLAAKVRALVTTYGMPLRVQAPRPTDQEHRWRKDAAERQRFARAYLEKIPEWARQIAVTGDAGPGASDRSTPQGTPSGPHSDPDQALLERLNTAVRDAADRIQRARDHESPEKIAAWANELARLSVQAGGMAALVQNLHASSAADSEQARAELDRLRQPVAQAETMIRILSEAPSDTNRSRAYQLAERVFGLQGILRLATVRS